MGITRRSPADPYAAYLPTAPAAGSCQPLGSGQFTGSGTHTIPAGTYCDLVKQTGSGTLTLSAGTYYLESGITTSGTSTLNTTGPVTLYIAGGGVSLAGSGGISMGAPTSGSYQGISIWQPSSNTTGATIVGSSTQVVSGLIYMPGAALTYTGTTVSTITTLVVNTLRMVGTSNINSSATTPWASLGPNGNFVVQ